MTGRTLAPSERGKHAVETTRRIRCENCERSFLTRRGHARWCSTRCRVAGYRRTKQGGSK